MTPGKNRTPDKRPAAFVLGLDVNGYGIVRSLAREGVRVVGVYGRAEDYGRLSRLCETRYLDPSNLEDSRICQRLIEWRAELDARPVIFATSDEYALLLARHRNILSDHFLHHWVTPESLEQIVDKSLIGRLCEEAGVLVPRTHVTSTGEDLAESAGSFCFPCLVKPVRSFRTSFPVGLKNFLARSPEGLLAFYAGRPELLGMTIWQEIIEGEDANVSQCNVLVTRSGQIGAVFGARKIHQYPPGFGSMSFGRSEENEVIVSQSLRLLRLLDHRGFASLEFKLRPADSCYYFIEMNPRLPWYNALFADAGVNLPYLAYLDLATSPGLLPPAMKQRNGVHWVSFADELRWFVRQRRAGATTLAGWLRSIAPARSFAWWSPRDPRPFLRASLDLVFAAARKLGRTLSRTAQGWRSAPGS